MAEEKPSGPSRTEKQAPSDRQPAGEKPPSRPPNGSRPRRENDGGGGEGGKPAKSGGALLWIFVALVVAATAYFLYRCQKKDPGPHPPPKITINVNDESFYKAFLSSLDFLSRAKAAFYQGQKWMTGVPESLPETTSTETLPQSPLFKAATQFALALEQFKYAEDLIKSNEGGPIKTELNVCRTQYLEALDKYQSTAKLYNEHAKAKYQEENDKLEKFALSDANANWALGERLMSDFLVKGCDGDLFRYLKEQTPEMRGKVLGQYQNFLGSDYAKYRAPLESQLGVTAEKVTPPPTAVPVPSP
ncbi:MAG TPA: hypothetical protein VJR29_14625 [bacterium]|nr:hypothetical protein [bacterium]